MNRGLGRMAKVLLEADVDPETIWQAIEAFPEPTKGTPIMTDPNKVVATITLTDSHWVADVAGHGRYSAPREDVHKWLTHPNTRHDRFVDVWEGEQDADARIREFSEEYPPLLQAIMVADFSPLSTTWDGEPYDWFKGEGQTRV